MTKTFIQTLLLAFAVTLSVPALAERADRNKPMNIESDTLRYDDVKQSSVFTGRVVATKGTIVIRGARMDVRQDPEGYQYGVVTAEPGKLAYFRQKREGVDEYIEGEGEVIEYDGKADNVKFIRQAVMRRFYGATLGDETTGNVITYNNTTDVFTVNGAAAQPNPASASASAPARNGRVRAMLSPRPAASQPSAGASSPAPALRPSTTLEGVQQ